MMKHSKRRLGPSIWLTVILASMPLAASAQDDYSSNSDSNRGSIYYFGDNDELLMRVNVWGFVQKPGQYMVPKDTDLISLISFAGGPREQAKLSKIKLIRRENDSGSEHVQKGESKQFAMNGPQSAISADDEANALARGDGKQLIHKVNVKRYKKTGDESLIPQLKPGDTIIVEGSRFHFITKALDFTGRLAVFVNIYYLIKLSQNR